MISIKLGNCLDYLKQMPNETIDMVMTSPPYDDIKNYNKTLKWNMDIFQQIANELERVLKQGGVIVWVVADKTKNSSETGTSFRQALYFKELGLNIYDTMIYKKLSYTPLTHRRYEQEFEYMFCFSKGVPKTFNPIMIPCKYAGTSTWGKVSYYKTSNDELVAKDKIIVKDKKIKGNVFEYRTGSVKTGKIKHPAMFPYELAKDQILTWSNENEFVLDPFMGSGTSGVVCKNHNRHFIGIEIVENYYNIAENRIKENIY